MTDVRPELVFYWRPGCGSCVLLRGQLRRSRIPTREVNIWDDPAAAAVLRGYAHGTETVPTIVVGDTALVNPSIRRVLAVLRERAPQLVPDAATGTAQTTFGGTDLRAALALVIFALGWLALGLTHPHTTYHFAPLLIAAAGPTVLGWSRGGPLARSVAIHAATGSTAIALISALVLAAAHALRGPSLIGPAMAAPETLIAVAAGALLGLFAVAARPRITDHEGAR